MSSQLQPEYLTPPTVVTNTATTTSSTAAIDVLGTASPSYYNFSVKGSPVHILFGPSAVAAATTSNAFYMPADTMLPFFINADTRYFRVIATSTVTGQAVSVARSGP